MSQFSPQQARDQAAVAYRMAAEQACRMAGQVYRMAGPACRMAVGMAYRSAALRSACQSVAPQLVYWSAAHRLAYRSASGMAYRLAVCRSAYWSATRSASAYNWGLVFVLGLASGCRVPAAAGRRR